MRNYNEDFLWVEKYRPHTIEDTVLPKELKTTFQEFINNKEIPNLILSGTSGVGKTTVARAMLDEIGSDYIIINGSLEGRQIDTLRVEIMNYASSMSITASGRKYIILDEADFLNPQSVQPALRNFMESYSHNCGFILTCNFRTKIIDALQSRCSVIEFSISSKDRAPLAAQFYKRIVTILKNEQIEFDSHAVGALINKFFPDFRRTLNELQRYSINGKIDSGILTNFQEKSFNQLISFMKDKNFSEIRKWITENSDVESGEIYKELYNTCSKYIQPGSIPILIILLAKYQYQDSFAIDKSINTLACLLEIMAEVKFL